MERCGLLFRNYKLQKASEKAKVFRLTMCKNSKCMQNNIAQQEIKCKKTVKYRKL